MSFVRELGAAERIYCREQTDYGNQTLVQAIILSNTNQITESKARQALIQLYHDYCPVLGYTICSSDDQTTLVYKSKDRHLAEEHLMLNFKYEKNLNWSVVFENELNTPLDNDNLTRWIMIDGHILLTSFHHALVDAKNLFYITRHYLFLCLSSTTITQKNIALEPMEKYLFDRYAYETISDFDYQPRAQRSNPIVSQTGIRHFYLSESILKRLIDQCHAQKIRLNSILTSITASAYYRAAGYHNDKTLKIHMMVNIRPKLDLDFEQIGMFVTVFDCLVHLNEQSCLSLWPNAIEQHHDLHHRIDEKEYIRNCQNDSDLLKLIHANELLSCDDVQFAFSNLGLLPNLDSNAIVEQYFGVSLVEQRWTSSILLGISTIHNHLCFTITYNKNQIQNEFLDKWIENIYYLLEQIEKK